MWKTIPDTVNETWSNCGKLPKVTICKLSLNGKETLAEGFKYQKTRIYFLSRALFDIIVCLFTNLNFF